MSLEMIFLSVCAGGLLIFLISLIVSTLIMDTRLFISYQFLLSSLKYSKDADEKLNFILAKVEAGLLIPKLNSNTISFYEKSENSTQYYGTPYAQIWIGSKYYTYGYLHELNGDRIHEKRRGKLKTFKKIVHLEDTLNGTIKPKEEKKTETKKDDTVILN